VIELAFVISEVEFVFASPVEDDGAETMVGLTENVEWC